MYVCYYFYNLMSNGNYNIMRFPFHGTCTTAIIAMNIIMLGSCRLHLMLSIVSILVLYSYSCLEQQVRTHYMIQ